MNRRNLLSLLGMSPAFLAGARTQAQPDDKTLRKTKSGAAPSAAQFTALNPKGSPPPVKLIPMAPRLDTIHGKTIYLVDTGFMSGGVLLQQMQVWFQKNYPDVTVVFRKKAGAYMEDDPPLWKEIKANGNAAIMAIGH
ncbi:MAG: hypothetical protein WCC21_20300 [Candidatus Acidiferrales bacterium]